MPSFFLRISLSGVLLAGLAGCNGLWGGQSDLPVSLAFSPASSSLQAGSCSGPLSVQALDSSGSPAAVSASITLSLSSPSGSFYTDSECESPSSQAVIAPGSNSATFYFSATLAGSVTLSASASGLTATGASLVVSAGPAESLRFASQPGASVAGAPISPSLQVNVVDNYGNLVTESSAQVTLALSNGASLSGQTSVNATNGVAQFGSLIEDVALSSYVLIASSPNLQASDSLPFGVSPAAPSQLAIFTSAAQVVAGACSGAVKIESLDSFGNLSPADSTAISVTPTDPSLKFFSDSACTQTISSILMASEQSSVSLYFSGTAAAASTLTASANGLKSATQSETIVPGTASKLAFLVQPTNTTAGQSITPAVTVATEDAFGNLVPSSTLTVTMAIGTNAGSGVLNGTLTEAAAAGVASFSNLSINQAATGYTLTASSGALSAATSAAFNISSGTASKLVFIAQPSALLANATITPAPQVAVEDSFGNRVTSSSSSIAMTINPASGGLGGTTTVAASSGVAIFSSLSVATAGNYTLTGASMGLTSTTSSSFNVLPLLSITTASLAQAIQNAAYSASIAISGGVAPYVFSVVSGSLPPGITLNSAGALSGSPTSSGLFSFTTQVADSGQIVQKAQKALSINVVPQLVINTSSLPSGAQGSVYTASLSASGGVSPYSWSLTSGTLPAGLTLSTSGLISGTPSASGTFQVTLQAKDSGSPAQSASQSYSLSIQAPPPTISALSPAVGSSLGGTSVTVTGSAFQSGIQVSFGTISASSVTYVSSTQIKAITPAGAVGYVNVQVTNPGGQSATLMNGFLYASAPTITGISPNSGTASGGTVVTITGTEFEPMAGVSIGANAATSVTVVSSTQIQAVTPSGTAGALLAVSDLIPWRGPSPILLRVHLCRSPRRHWPREPLGSLTLNPSA